MTPPDLAERKVLRWFLAALFVSAAVMIAFTWLTKSRACTDYCLAQGKTDGRLQFLGGGRLNMGTVCVCDDEVQLER
jgi:hypothetical protein